MPKIPPLTYHWLSEAYQKLGEFGFFFHKKIIREDDEYKRLYQAVREVMQAGGIDPDSLR